MYSRSSLRSCEWSEYGFSNLHIAPRSSPLQLQISYCRVQPSCFTSSFSNFSPFLFIHRKLSISYNNFITNYGGFTLVKRQFSCRTCIIFVPLHDTCTLEISTPCWLQFSKLGTWSEYSSFPGSSYGLRWMMLLSRSYLAQKIKSLSHVLVWYCGLRPHGIRPQTFTHFRFHFLGKRSKEGDEGIRCGLIQTIVWPNRMIKGGYSDPLGQLYANAGCWLVNGGLRRMVIFPVSDVPTSLYTGLREGTGR